ncbi:carboxylate-amine ligase [Paeniglutamicibacter kerguelensis]|uniref:Putative glutamate--cysteine ligase 2 n=1 Tax=Paeniglutamicibacter kerguelensis TaxID=254788 RepID=A0ABS4XC00_9MICC|nr:carboxylate-amine ligase [Paeniglutamicibacter kerguelensis]
MDAQTGLPAVPDESAVAALMNIEGGGSSTSRELLSCQTESATPICTNAKQALESLQGYRRALATGAESLGFRAVGIGTAPVVPEHPATVADTPRYRDMAARAAGIVDDQYVNGLHVHVEVPDRAAGVRVLNSLRPWLPLFTAIGGNSPMWRGRDSGFASWRTIHYRRWSVQGIPPCFAGINDYDLRLKRMLATDVVLDCGHIAWAARLSDTYPTIEVRASDTQLEAKDSVLIALLIRAVVGAELEDPAQPDGVADPEMLDIALWKAARDGLGGELIDPGDGESRPAEEIVGVLMARIEPVLSRHGDLSFVERGLAGLFENGTGAQRLRRVHADVGMPGLLDYAASALLL